MLSQKDTLVSPHYPALLSKSRGAPRVRAAARLRQAGHGGRLFAHAQSSTAQNSTAYGEDDMVLDVKLWAERCACAAWAGARGQLRAGKTRSGAECVGWARCVIPLDEPDLSSDTFPLETSIFLERFPLERERFCACGCGGRTETHCNGM